jgi:RNA-directed DNA polymerase
VNWILDADIRSFFDEIDHGWMLRFLEHRIADRRLLALIRKWLKAGVVENGGRVASERGTPQGAVVSPLLANIYLHYVLDLWAHHWRTHCSLGDVVLVRYADDSVFGFENKKTAQRFLEALVERVARFGLSLNLDKTRLIEFGLFAEINRRRRGTDRPETFDFLGFTHCCGTSRQGKFRVIRLTVKKRMRATLAAIRETLMRKRHEPVSVTGSWLKRVVQGYFNYHAVPTNLIRLVFAARSVALGGTPCCEEASGIAGAGDRFNRLAARFVPYPRKLHDYPERRFHASRP